MATLSRSTQACAVNFSPSLRTPIRNCVAMPCRASNHHRERDRSRQVEGIGEFRAAASTMREVNAHDSLAATGGLVFLWEMNFCSKRCVGPKPGAREPTE